MLFDRYSRRERGLLMTAISGLVVVSLIAGYLLWTSLETPGRYLPGQQVRGLTSSLSRESPEQLPEMVFRDVSGQAKIDFRHFHGRRSSQLPEDMGSGVAWIDYNNDNWPDLFVANIAGPLTASSEQIADSPAHCALYRNEGDGTFRDVSVTAGVAIRDYVMGVARGDYNNDGWTDLFLTSYGENYLLRNEGDGTFQHVSDQAGMGRQTGFWTGAAWGDYNRDGHLDLYVTGYVQYDSSRYGGMETQYEIETPASLNPSSFSAHRNVLYRNEGDGTFTEVAAEAGVADRKGKGLAVVWADLTGDGWPDLYVANDVSDNVLFRNERDGTFREISRRARVADYRGAMGLAVGDWDHDQDLDLFISHWIAQENAFYVNLGRPTASPAGPESTVQFMDESDRYGLGQVALDYVGWGTSFFDYDNDRNLDLFVVNGNTLQQDDRPELLEPQPDLLFWNRGNHGGFYDASAISGTAAVFQDAHGNPLIEERVGRGAAIADYDRDGDMDLAIVNHGASLRLFQNRTETGRHWLNVRLHGRASNRSAIGARVMLYADSLVQTRAVSAQGSYLSQNSLVQHVGLGAVTGIDSLVIDWPSGQRQTLEEVPVDTLIAIRESRSVQATARSKE